MANLIDILLEAKGGKAKTPSMAERMAKLRASKGASSSDKKDDVIDTDGAEDETTDTAVIPKKGTETAAERMAALRALKGKTGKAKTEEKKKDEKGDDPTITPKGSGSAAERMAKLRAMKKDGGDKKVSESSTMFLV